MDSLLDPTAINYDPIRKGKLPAMSNSAFQRLLVFSPNLAIDHIIELEQISLGEVQRATLAYLSAGGKGVNVARASTLLGNNPVVVGLVGGDTGILLRTLLSQEGLEVRSPRFNGKTRFATIIVDTRDNSTTVLNEKGPEVGQHTWSAVLELVRAELDRASVLVCTGSLPLGIADDGYSGLIRSANGLRKTTILDANGAVLAKNMTSHPTIIKVNLKEAQTVVPEEIGPSGAENWRQALNAASQLRPMASRAAIVTIPEGAAICCDEASVFLSAPTVNIRNEIGAGDSLMAGLANSLIAGDNLIVACTYGVAAAAASVETGQPGMLNRSRVEQLVVQVKSHNL